MLVGNALLKFVEMNDGHTEHELAEAAGYTKQISGKSSIQLKAFTNALLEAKGVKLKTKTRGGKKAPFKTAVHQSGIVLLGKTYSEKFDLKPGDELEIQLLEDSIKLIPTGKAVTRDECCLV